MNEAYICLGGNEGNCLISFEKAILSLQKGDISVTKRSSVYITEAWGMENAPDFHNLVIEVKTGLPAQELMNLLLETERSLGRERKTGNRYESRTIDLDILFYNNDIILSENLEVPHPRMHLRRFVLEPLNEITPDLEHPILKKTIAKLLQECPDKNAVKRSEHVF
ncbi:MAG: 2-amino-4-hydroxy-6-hydroxymethyldihydropteridine diphosphokinase [Bacteroidia bacterium]